MHNNIRAKTKTQIAALIAGSNVNLPLESDAFVSQLKR